MKIFNTLNLMLGICISSLIAAPDCLDTSSNLQEKSDYKELHYVSCNHDCYKDPNSCLVENKGKCSVCGHYHLPRPLIMVKTTNPAALPVLNETTKKRKNNQLARLFGKDQKDISLVPHKRTRSKE